MKDAFQNVELEFPFECHFKVIAEDLNNMHFTIETVLMELGINEPVLPGNRSSNSKYISYNISVVVDDKPTLDAIDRELRLIEGVRMVL